LVDPFFLLLLGAEEVHGFGEFEVEALLGVRREIVGALGEFGVHVFGVEGGFWRFSWDCLFLIKEEWLGFGEFGTGRIFDKVKGIMAVSLLFGG
jgi:hypothetical protein